MQLQLVSTCAFPRLRWYPSPMTARDSPLPRKAPCAAFTSLPRPGNVPYTSSSPMTHGGGKSYLGTVELSHMNFFQSHAEFFLHKIPLNEVLLHNWDTRPTGERRDCATVDGAWNMFAWAQKCHRGVIFHTIQGHILIVLFFLFFILLVVTKTLKQKQKSLCNLF